MTGAAAIGVARSWLYVPGDRPDRLARAGERGADALIVDLEDAVALPAKEVARAAVARWLVERRPTGAGAPAVWVRVNNGRFLAADLEAMLRGAPDGIILPKADEAATSQAAGLLEGTGIALGALIETARGLQEVATVAALPAVSRLAIGEADLVADLGLDPSADERELWPLRMQVVVAAAAAGIDPPAGPVSTDFRDLDTFRESTEALRRAGFGSRAAIHPDQVAVINEVFTPTTAEVEHAESLVAAYEEAAASGSGVTLDSEGRMVDEAVIRSARRLLARARR